MRYPLFQFHKGSIKTDKITVTIPLEMSFNSIKVRLRQEDASSNPPFPISFNSIKVRLRLATTEAGYTTQSFQFHKGSIKTRCTDRSVRSPTMFQFHKGSIKTSSLLSGAQDIHGLNSIKVRLRPTSTYRANAPFSAGFRMQRYEKKREKYVDVG